MNPEIDGICAETSKYCKNPPKRVGRIVCSEGYIVETEHHPKAASQIRQ
jgi:hypothetical protein